jgi:quercetin 2,3-dioxygenase
MISIRAAQSRGYFNFGWLDTRHTFSFGEYVDQDHERFRALRVLNEDRVSPGQGFGTHGHRDMEILTWVLSGALEHRDSLGTHGLIRPGEAQIMSAGTGIRHSEFNASATEPVHFLQIWILPERLGLTPRYAQEAFTEEDLRNRLCLIASSGSVEGAVQVFQDLKVFAARLDPGRAVEAAILPGRAGYLQVASGTIRLNGSSMQAGDGARVEGEPAITVIAESPSEIMFFDLA